MYYMADITLDFGKNKGKKLSEVESGYLKYLCNYTIEYDEDEGKLIYCDSSDEDLMNITMNFNCYVDQCVDLEETLVPNISKTAWWTALKKLKLNEQYKKIYEVRKELDMVYETRMMSIYLYVFKQDVIKAARSYLDINKKCRFCHGIMPVIADRRLNGTDAHVDWDNRYLHKKCYKEIINSE